MSQPPRPPAGKPPVPAAPDAKPAPSTAAAKPVPRLSGPPAVPPVSSPPPLGSEWPPAPSGRHPAIPSVPAAVARPPLPGIKPITSLPGITPLPPRASPAVRAPVAAQIPPGLGLTLEQMADLEVRFDSLDELDYFQLLKVEHTAGIAEIKRAFYQESRTYHPDRFFQVGDVMLKTRIHDVYKRVTEAYYVLRDEPKRRRYLADVTGPQRTSLLRFNESAGSEGKLGARKEAAAEQVGQNPKARQFFQSALADLEAGRWSAAERSLKMAVTYEPANERYKEKLAEAQKQLFEEQKAKGNTGFTIK